MFTRLFREYLSLTRGERHGLQVLVFLVILLVLVRSFMPLIVQYQAADFTAAGREIAGFLDSLQTLDKLAAARKGIAAERMGSVADMKKFPVGKYDLQADLFPFDPNTADLEDLIRLGIPPGTARTLVNYRQKGGSFARDSDLLRVYGLNPDIYARLQPYIRLPDISAGREHHFFRKSFQPFELNRADSQQLIAVYGIGPVFARRIIRYRELLGGFCRPDQLMEVYGFSLEQFEELMRCSFIDTSLLRRMDLNSMDADSLSVHPYLDRYQAGALVSYREYMGSFSDASQVLENRLLPDSVFLRIHPYLSAGH